MHRVGGGITIKTLLWTTLIWSAWAAASGPIVDGDADGVSDEIDACLYSRPGETVNALGCSLGDDGDGDGIPDRYDFCLSTPQGQSVDPFGCESGSARAPAPVFADGDGDGVSDREDVCPYTSPGSSVDPDGCALDGDLDGVPDGIDRCPSSPVGSRVTAVGCPAPVLPRAPASSSQADARPMQIRPAVPPAQLPVPGVNVAATVSEIAALATPLQLLEMGRELLRLSQLEMPFSAQQLQRQAEQPALPPPGLPPDFPSRGGSSTVPVAAVSPAPLVVDRVPAPATPTVVPQQEPVVPQSQAVPPQPSQMQAPVAVNQAAMPTPISESEPVPSLPPIPAAPVRVVESRAPLASIQPQQVALRFVRGSSELDGQIISRLRGGRTEWQAELQAEPRQVLEVLGNREDPEQLAQIRAEIVRAYLMAQGLPARRIVARRGLTEGASVLVRLQPTLE